VQGDQHEQADERTVWGGQASQSWFLGPNWKDTEITAGLQLRHDRISKVGLYTTENRRRTGHRARRQDRGNIASLFEARTEWTGWLRTNLGLRRDQIYAKSTALGGQYNMDNGGSTDAGQTSPKLGVVFGPFNLLGQPSSTPTGVTVSTATTRAAPPAPSIRRTARPPKPYH
jgi:hypothetical protein